MQKAKPLQLLFYMLVVCSSCTARKTLIEDRNISELIERTIDEADIPGIGALIAIDGEIVHLSATGKRSNQHSVKVELHDKWHLGSDTKAMTAFLIGLAVQENRLSYASKVTEVLNLDSVIDTNKKISVSDLLLHQTYLKDVQEIQSGELWKKMFTSKKSVVELRLQMGTEALREAPRKNGDGSFDYANINYVLLGAILERVYKLDWETLLKTKVFEPLKMNSCGFGVAGDLNERDPSEPWAHALQDKKLMGIHPKHKPDNPAMLGPAGTVHCSLKDWNKFIQELIIASEGRGSLLTKKDIVQKYFRSPNDGDYPYTLGGWGYNRKTTEYPIYQHSGSNTFNLATALFSPKKRIVILLTMNVAEPKAEKHFMSILREVAIRYLKN